MSNFLLSLLQAETGTYVNEAHYFYGMYLVSIAVSPIDGNDILAYMISMSQ